MGNQETFWLRAIGFGHNLVDSNILWNGYAWQAPVKSLQAHFRHWPNGCLKALGFRALCGIRQLPRLPSRLHNAAPEWQARNIGWRCRQLEVA